MYDISLLSCLRLAYSRIVKLRIAYLRIAYVRLAYMRLAYVRPASASWRNSTKLAILLLLLLRM